MTLDVMFWLFVGGIIIALFWLYVKSERKNAVNEVEIEGAENVLKRQKAVDHAAIRGGKRTSRDTLKWLRDKANDNK